MARLSKRHSAEEEGLLPVAASPDGASIGRHSLPLRSGHSRGKLPDLGVSRIRPQCRSWPGRKGPSSVLDLNAQGCPRRPRARIQAAESLGAQEGAFPERRWAGAAQGGAGPRHQRNVIIAESIRLITVLRAEGAREQGGRGSGQGQIPRRH